jgi:hypothetical protein
MRKHLESPSERSIVKGAISPDSPIMRAAFFTDSFY